MSRPGVYDVPHDRHPWAGYLLNVTIGNPPQTIPMFNDWTWVQMYTLTTKCMGDEENTWACLNHDQPYYNQTESKTFRNVTDRYPRMNWNPNHFFFYEDMWVEHATEVTTVGSATSTVVFEASDFSFDSTAMAFPFAGVYGMSPVFEGDKPDYQSTFYQQWKSGAWATGLTAFHYCYDGSPDVEKEGCHGYDAIQTMGGYRRDLIQDKKIYWYDITIWDWVNYQNFIWEPKVINYWTLDISQMSIGDEPVAINKTTGGAAIFDHASFGRGAPLSIDGYAYLVDLAQAEPITLQWPPNNGNQSFFSVDCNKRDTLPPIKYAFSGHDKVWEIPAKYYVENIDEATCVLNVRTLGYGEMSDGNFGDQFVMDKYLIFDFEKLRVGLADVKW
ncbi:eukaryotic aspartyl protease [Eremomyces bilateralis CBS 781.70]|uniref:Eukaryotic aspartyl protease n=1 Tax=Eremomyces bilateralis CBS 781.70 TaxID=1392243 RepID=A0A6G1G627_9PEZI|nr:eukaryotic aspartyl protease [Eremomyces bilateralis CBS 781.70]KAF1813472.1 eukaryotic aspartyl protease [Eremomyces bilateralis CBS 781.70]